MGSDHQTVQQLLEAIAAACGDVDWNAKRTGFNTLCVAHADKSTKSLKFEIVRSKKYGGDTIAAKCFAGCSQEQIRDGLLRKCNFDYWKSRARLKGGGGGFGMDKGNPFAAFHGSRKRKVKAFSGEFSPTTLAESRHNPGVKLAWQYRNFGGVTAYTVRMPKKTANPDTGKPEKDIRQHPPNIPGPWFPLFTCWPVDPEKPLVVCEGEMALEALKIAGVQGMTFKGGVSLKGSLKRMIEPLVAAMGEDCGLKVVLWPDAAPDGLAYMDAAGRHFLALSRCKFAVHLVDTRNFDVKADAADFEVDQIHEIVEAAPRFGAGKIVWIGPDEWQAMPGDENRLMLSPEAYSAAEEANLLSGDQLDTTAMTDAEAVEMALALLGIDVRLDVRSEIVQYRGRNLLTGRHTHGGGPVDPNGWLNPDANLNEAIISAVQGRSIKMVQTETREGQGNKYRKQAKRRVFSPAAFDRAIKLITHLRRVDPFRQWLENLPEWDSEPRLDGLIFKLFDVPDEALGDNDMNALYRWASRSWFMTAVARTYRPGLKQDAHPVLCGDQGIGKSTVVRHSLPPEHEGWFTDSLNLEDKNKEQAETLEGVVIAEIPEFESTDSRRIGLIKAFLSRQDFKVRKAYARTAQFKKRTDAVVITTNSRTPLPNDESGNRRFVMIELKSSGSGAPRAKVKIEDHMAENREQLWAEALYRVIEKGESVELPRYVMQRQAEINEDYRNRDESLENALEEAFGKDGISEPKTLEAIAVIVGVLHQGAKGEYKPLRQHDANVQKRLVKAMRNWAQKNGMTIENKRYRVGQKQIRKWATRVTRDT